jgi:hypothetical protein
VYDRRDQAKSAKNLLQAATLIESLAVSRPLELAKSWHEAWDTGPRWKEKLEIGLARLAVEHQDMLRMCWKSQPKRKDAGPENSCCSGDSPSL